MTDTPHNIPLGLGVIATEGSSLAYSNAIAAIEDLRLVALLDSGDEVHAIRTWHRQVGRCRVHRDIDEFMQDAAVQVVLVLARPEERPTVAGAVVQAGKPCLVAAPVCQESALCAGLLHDASMSGVLIMPAHLLRYEPAVLRAAESLRAGAIGEPRELRSEWSFSQAWERRAWPSAAVYHALETLDLGRWWLGEVVAVSADMENAATGGSAPHASNIILQHERGTSIHHIYRTSGTPRHERYVLLGSEGVLELTGPASGVLERGGGLRASLCGRSAEAVALDLTETHLSLRRTPVRPPFRNLLEDFVSAVRTGRKPLATMQDAVEALRLLEAARISSREGVKVQVASPE